MAIQPIYRGMTKADVEETIDQVSQWYNGVSTVPDNWADKTDKLNQAGAGIENMDPEAVAREKINALVSGANAEIPPDASLYLDFLNGRYYCTAPTDTHATDILALGSGGYQTFAPNVLPRTDLGLLTTVTQTNLFLNSDAPATQSVTILSARVYTVRVWGSGSITLSGAATGTVEEGSPVTFTSSGTSLTLTVSGSLDYAMLVEASFATDPIITEGSTVTRPGNMPVIDLTGRLGGVTAGATALRTNAAGVLFLLNDGSADNFYGLIRDGNGSIHEWHSIGGTLTATQVGVGSTGRLVVAYALAEGYHRMEVIGLGDTGPLTHSLPPLDRKHYGSIGLDTSINMYGVTEQDAMIFSATDPETAFAQAKALAQEWAAQ